MRLKEESYVRVRCQTGGMPFHVLAFAGARILRWLRLWTPTTTYYGLLVASHAYRRTALYATRHRRAARAAACPAPFLRG